MKPIRTVVVDDERPARERISDLLAKTSGFEVTGVCRDGAEAVGFIRAHQPDLVFLDIQMPILDGFGVVKQVGPEHMPVTVFVTAFDEYALQAFEANALDYLLKPFSDERFEAALRRAQNSIRVRRVSEATDQLGGLLEALETLVGQGQSQYLDRVVLRSTGRALFLEVSEIDWVEGAGVYVILHTQSKDWDYRATLGQFERRLDPKQFIRVHRSAIVNVQRIRELQVRTHGDYTLILKNGTELRLSRNYRADVERWLKQPL